VTKEERLQKFEDVDLYPVTCEKLSEGRSNFEVLEGIIQGGAKIVQLREKEISKQDLYRMALRFREITSQAGVLLIINDHLDIALAVGADGVHLGQDDLPIHAAVRLAPDLIIGGSTHSIEEAVQAQSEGADYVNIGPVFPTKTKEKVARFLGPKAIAEISTHIQLPFTTMGGIKADNIDHVVKHGARRIAVVTAITRAPNIAAATRELRSKILSRQ